MLSTTSQSREHWAHTRSSAAYLANMCEAGLLSMQGMQTADMVFYTCDMPLRPHAGASVAFRHVIVALAVEIQMGNFKCEREPREGPSKRRWQSYKNCGCFIWLHTKYQLIACVCVCARSNGTPAARSCWASGSPTCCCPGRPRRTRPLRSRLQPQRPACR